MQIFVVNAAETVKADKESPRGVLENPGVGSDSDSGGCSSSSNLICPPKPIPCQKNNKLDFNGFEWNQFIGTIKKKTPISFSFFPMVTNYDISRKTLMKKITKLYGAEDDDCIPNVKPSWKNFAYSELAAATDNFSPQNLLGEGGSAQVYKGTLSDGQVVAVKKFIKNDKENEERSTDLLSELGIITHINHPNAAHLVGYSIDRGLILVLQFSPHGSLANLLFGSNEGLDWKIRFKVALGIAEGLKYLHHDCPRRIIHRDIKASNILLTEDYEPQISDFGLAKWLPENWEQHVVHPIEGTFGYLAPEYFMHGIVDEKTDVFAFGVLLLEILTGRRAVDSLSRQSLVIWAKPLLESDDVKKLVDPKLGDSYDPTEMKLAMSIASQCISHLASMRPSMKKVVEMLKGEEQGGLEHQPKACGEKPIILDNCDSQTYNQTSYQDDLNRHMQLVME
ncbi:ROP binding protein kinases 1 [Hibiscus trionum]|uniref:non-specific serine/threonine protein kinase n=1 Tax=Hibiscus trionum TaxID=183268 RepID=A0A9W7I1Q0_HIBTR|nr:ROP binding protein kinases 1 [Hibiscus trionum]